MRNTTDVSAADISIDTKYFILETDKELDEISKRVSKFKGIEFQRTPQAILRRMWLDSDNDGQKRIERRKEKWGIDFKRERGRGAG